MLITQKCQYAIKAILALARHERNRPIKIAQIAEEQGIPYRFLEVILSQLKQGGFVDSRRGNEGGYLLARAPSKISVAQIVSFVDGPIFGQGQEASGGAAGDGHGAAPATRKRRGQQDPEPAPDVLTLLWKRAEQAIYGVFENTSIADLVAEDDALRAGLSPNYVI